METHYYYYTIGVSSGEQDDGDEKQFSGKGGSDSGRTAASVQQTEYDNRAVDGVQTELDSIIGEDGEEYDVQEGDNLVIEKDGEEVQATVKEVNDDGSIEVYVAFEDDEVIDPDDANKIVKHDSSGKDSQVDTDDLDPSDPRVIEEEFGIDLSDVREQTPNGGVMEDETQYPVLDMTQQEIGEMMEEHHDEKDVEDVIMLIDRWKRKSDGEAGMTLEAIAKESQGIDADIRDISDAEVDMAKVNDGTAAVFNDLTRISRAFAKEHIADEDDKVTLHRGMNSRTNETNLLESYLANPDADELQINGSVMENLTMSEPTADHFANTFRFKQDVDVNDITLAPDMVVQTSESLQEAELHVKGDSLIVNKDDIEVVSGSRDLLQFGNDEADFGDTLSAIRSPEEADTQDQLTAIELFEQWSSKATDKQLDGTVEGVERYQVSDKDAVANLEAFGRTIEESDQWSDTAVTNIQESAESIVDGNVSFESTAETYASAGGTSSAGTEGYDFTQFTPEKAERTGSLNEYAAKTGVNADDMYVAEIPGHNPSSVGDEGLAFVTEYGDGGAKQSLGERTMVAAEAASELGGSVPEHVGDPSDGWVAVEGVTNATEASRATADQIESVDSETFYDEAATQIIVDNFDAHPDNVMVDNSGNLHWHDLDHSSGELDSDFTGNKGWYENKPDRVLDELSHTASSLGVGSGREVKEQMLSRAEQRAQSMSDSEVDRVVQSAAKHNREYAENIRKNINALRDGSVRERWEQAQ